MGVLQTQGSRIKGWLTATDCQLYGCCSVAKSYQSLRLYATLWTIARQTLCPSLSSSLLKIMSIELVRLSNHLILCHLLLLLPSIFPRIRVFSSESALYIRWPKDWSFSFSISPSDEYSGLISTVLGTLKSLLQRHSSKASVLRCSAFFIVQLSHPYMTTGKTIALTRWTFVDKVIAII